MFECAALTYRVYKINPDFFFFKKLTLGHSVINFLKISRCRYITNTILANGKVATRDSMHRLAHCNVGTDKLDMILPRIASRC
jgi:hypothetical protein